MSLDVYLYREKWVSYDEGKTHEKSWDILYDGNITHNLGEMAKAAGIYYALWRPEEINAEKASDIIPLLEKGLDKLKNNPNKYEKYNSPNGWGLYKHFVPFVAEYLAACKQYPNAKIEVSR